MKISIIIPVYKAALYLAKAVESALNQEETGEVILIEDGSPDNALEVCLELARKYDKVKLFQHADKGNHGAGASRNLGIRNATFEYIAFLDADDYMLPNRFKTTIEVLKENPDADGVYEAVGVEFEDDTAKQRWYTLQNREITTVEEIVHPSKLFQVLVSGKGGYFCTDGFVFRRSLIEKVGYFSTDLILSQDTHFFYKSAAMGSLYPGNLVSPVAIRRVHSANRSHSDVQMSNVYKRRMWDKLFVDLLDKRSINSSKKDQLYTIRFNQWKALNDVRYSQIRFWLLTGMAFPRVIFQSFYWNIFLSNLFVLIRNKFSVVHMEE